jgi:hypothetical protein
MSKCPPRWLSRPLAAVTVSAILACGTAVPATASAAAIAAARVTAIPAPRPGPARALAAAVTQVTAAAPVFLLNGDRLRATPGRAGAAIAVAPGTGPSSLLMLQAGGRTQAIPADVLRYLGHGLSPSLFDLGALRRAERYGRLPLHITFRGRRPRLPGVTVTRSGAGYEDGYLTAAAARRFGATLAPPDTAGHADARPRHSQDSLFGGGTEIALAGAPAPAAQRPATGKVKVTLTMSATNLLGHPDNGGSVLVFNEDNAKSVTGTFKNGTATFRVPPGPYWAAGSFTENRGLAERFVVLPQFTVRGNTTVSMAERSASSKLQFTTPRPAALRWTSFTLFRGAPNGALVFLGLLGIGSGTSLWISPTTSKPTIGTLYTESAGQLTSPPGSSGTPYAYSLADSGLAGLIPAQHFTASPANLATISENYYQDTASTGSWCTIGGNIMPNGAGAFSCLVLPLRLPGTQTQYLSAAPSAVWQTSYTQSRTALAGGQSTGLENFRPRQQVAQNWNAYPLHPQPDVQTLHGRLAQQIPAFPSAFRTGNVLRLRITPFSDNYTGHFGTGFRDGTGSYAIYQNGTRVASGNPAAGIRKVRLSPNPSVIKFTLTASRQRSKFPLSSASATTWTWRSAPRPGATVPPSWYCGFRFHLLHRCAIQPMMTLTYQVAGLALNGTAAAGSQTINLSVGHLPLAKAARITGASAKVSFNDGHTYRAVTVTPQGGGRFRISFTAPAGTKVTLRVSATDAAGGSVTETIRRGYAIAR